MTNYKTLCPHCAKEHWISVMVQNDVIMITDENRILFEKKINKFQRWMLKRLFNDYLD